MMIRNIRTNIYKILTGYGFYICIIFTAVLCFSAYIYEDSMNGDKYSVFMAYKTFDKDFMLSDTRFCSFEVMLCGHWLYSAISALLFHAENMRCKSACSKCYGLFKFITACACSGFAVIFGLRLVDYAYSQDK